MPVGDESIGFGGTVTVDDGGTGAAPGAAATEVTHVTSLGVPSRTTGTVESKRLDLPARVIRKLPTLTDGGEFAIKQQFTHAGFARFEAMRANRGTYTWVVTVPDDDGDTEVTVRGFVTANKTDALEAEKITEFESMVTVSEANDGET